MLPLVVSIVSSRISPVSLYYSEMAQTTPSVVSSNGHQEIMVTQFMRSWGVCDD